MIITQVTAPSQHICQAINELLKDLSSKPREFGMQELEAIVGNPSSHLFVAEESGKIIGMFTLAATLLPTGQRLWLEDVVITHLCQGKGLGKQLVEQAIVKAQELYPAASLMLTSRPSRIAANHIYQQLFEPKETNVFVKANTDKSICMLRREKVG